MDIDAVLKFISENSILHLASIGEGGCPHVRPFILFAELDGRLYLATSNKKAVYSELVNDCRVEISCASPYAHWMRIRGNAVFVEDGDLKEKVMEKSEVLDRFYSVDNRNSIRIFYIGDAEVFMSNLSDMVVTQFKL